ncbi:EpsG family protein [Marinomonas rhizomae]|nr:EpsG family protein [Marinomonas rhizomae]
MNLLGPNGVDWPAYSTVGINFDRFYFYREPVGWGFILLLRDYGHIYLSGLLLSFLSLSAFCFSYEISRSATLSFLLVIMLMGSSLFLLLSVNGMRQGLALVFIMLKFWAYCKKNKYAIFLFYILAILSHNSAAIFGIFFAFYFFSFVWFRYFILVFYFFSSSLIIEVASKNSNPTVNNNTFIFFMASIFVLVFSLFPRGALHKRELNFLSFSVFFLASSFMWSSSVYERLIYYTLPIAIVLSGSKIIVYKPKMIRYISLFFAILIVWTYSISHPSVIKNFLYAGGNLH